MNEYMYRHVVKVGSLLPSLWVLELEHRSSGLVASTVTCQTILGAQCLLFVCLLVDF